MKKLLTGLCVGGALLASLNTASATPSICDAVVGNLIHNCGFETGELTDWSESGTGAGGALTVPFSSNSGGWSVNLLSEGHSSWEIDQNFSTVAGTEYAGSFYIETYLTNVGGVFDALLNGKIVFEQNGYSNQFLNWTKETFTFTAAAGTSNIEFLLAEDGGQYSSWFIDDVVVTPNQVPEPASLLLLSGGLLASGFFGRRKRKNS